MVVGIIFIALLFYTFETLLFFSLIYLILIPVSIIIYKKQLRKYSNKISDEDHEDIYNENLRDPKAIITIKQHRDQFFKKSKILVIDQELHLN